MSLTRLYDPTGMPADLVAAHEALDVVMYKLFGLTGTVTLADRQKRLFQRYAKLSASSR